MSTFPQFPDDVDAVRRWARLAPSRVALVDDTHGARLTYAALDAASWAWAHVLRAAGVTTGDRVALLAGTRAECVALFYGCLRLGAVLVPLNWRLAPSELARVLADARPMVLVCDARHDTLAARALAVDGAPPRVATLRLDAADGVADAAPLPEPPSDAESATMLLYTSGSTGAPKGVILPRRQLLYNAVATVTGWRMTPDEVVPVSTPLFHTGGWHVFLTPVLHVGGTVVLFDGFEPARFLAGLAEHACTLAFAVPTQFTMLMAEPRWGEPLPALRRFVSGGAPCPPAVRAAIRAAGHGFQEGFGLTECGPNCFATNDETAEAHPGTVGWPIPFLSVRVVDEAGEDVPPGTPGELLLRGPQLFAGYFGAPERTAEALTADGWMRTGDLAVRDATGLTRICGRRKEMFISGGENVFPGEVEAALADCPGVAEVAVIGVPDDRWGEVGRAFVVARAGDPVDAARVVAFARGALAGYKVPKQVVLLDALPRLGSGKIDRRALAAMTEPATAGASA
ncbi:class I adenylate-forming enzyme family protein [Roseisolibacter agri]|uniref:Long-chain-fatty-acid--CoA ligase n=1 Tax=Roseisolibacter agri TaxID=2014610 RepID=A0AA37VCI7_9BACT|nr:AMP-binding protein [Roseisolibacter agri]GLC27718.1 long-chain-fatty-acid--CoA ligase [Roseisolibacter agri]